MLATMSLVYHLLKSIYHSSIDNHLTSIITIDHISLSLEEWAEGKLLLEWVDRKSILSRDQATIINNTEYIGAISDFTGEIGRLAVMHAGKRDYTAVYEVYEVMLVVHKVMTNLNANHRYNKKVEAIATNLRKLSELRYELCMLQRSGRRLRAKPSGGDGGSSGGGDEKGNGGDNYDA